jgi:hypothetical protein
MNSGINVFATRCLLGNLDVNPVTHCAYVGATRSDGRPMIGREIARGSGVFDESEGPPNYLRPLISLGRSGKAHAALMDASLGSYFYYSRIDSGLTWSDPFLISPPLPDPGSPDYVIAASKLSDKVSIVWLQRNRTPPRLNWERSTDEGMTWLAPDTIGLPPAFHPGSETLPSAIEVFPWYDPDEDEDALHMVASIVPIVGDSNRSMPAEIWHWSELSGWSLIVHAGCDPAHLRGTVGDDASYAGRPTLGRVGSIQHTAYMVTNDLVCVWEQFDSANVESLTGQLRADIWAARSDSSGRHWGPPIRLTDSDQTSKRFPCVADRTLADTCPVCYEVDRVAGFAELGQGPWTDNPIVVRWVPVSMLPQAGIHHQDTKTPGHQDGSWFLEAAPNPFSDRVAIRLAPDALGSMQYAVCSIQGEELEIRDVTGRLIRTLAVPGYRARSVSLTWDGRDNAGHAVAEGCYFCALKSARQSSQQKLLRTR